MGWKRCAASPSNPACTHHIERTLLQVKDVSAALKVAAGALPDGPIKAHLQLNLRTCGAALHKQLASGQPDAADAVKPARATRAKRAKALPEPEAPAAAAPAAAVEAPTLLDSTLHAAVERCIAGDVDPDLDPVAPLVARFPPPPGYLDWHLLRLHPGAAGGDAAATLAAADAAVRACNALAGQATSAAAALAAFAPAVSLLQRAAAALRDPAGGGGGGWAALAALAGRVLTCMHIAGAEVEEAAAADDAGAAADAASRWWLQWGAGDAAGGGAPRRAVDACAALVALRAAAHLQALKAGHHGAAAQGEDRQDRALAALAEADVRRLAPFAAVGTLARAAEAEAEEAANDRDAARCFLALHSAAASQGEQDLQLAINGDAPPRPPACRPMHGKLTGAFLLRASPCPQMGTARSSTSCA
jgi:hypothetical protein